MRSRKSSPTASSDAYDDSNDHIVDIVLSVDSGALNVEVIDDGRAFNPLEVPAPDLSLAMSDRPIGGLGIHLLRELADEVKYERRTARTGSCSRSECQPQSPELLDRLGVDDHRLCVSDVDAIPGFDAFDRFLVLNLASHGTAILSYDGD